jgi:hypothetical protein
MAKPYLILEPLLFMEKNQLRLSFENFVDKYRSADR